MALNMIKNMYSIKKTLSRSSGAVLLVTSFTRVKTLAYRYFVPPEHVFMAIRHNPEG